MFCKYCGNNIDEDSKFCSRCGRTLENAQEKPVEPQATQTPVTVCQPLPVQPTPPAEDQNAKREKESLASKILGFAIAGLAVGCCTVFAFVGIIFSSIARSFVRTYQEKYGEVTGKARVGKYLSLAGLISSIVFTAIFGFYFLLTVLLALIGGV